MDSFWKSNDFYKIDSPNWNFSNFLKFAHFSCRESSKTPGPSLTTPLFSCSIAWLVIKLKPRNNNEHQVTSNNSKPFRLKLKHPLQESLESLRFPLNFSLKEIFKIPWIMLSTSIFLFLFFLFSLPQFSIFQFQTLP